MDLRRNKYKVLVYPLYSLPNHESRNLSTHLITLVFLLNTQLLLGSCESKSKVTNLLKIIRTNCKETIRLHYVFENFKSLKVINYLRYKSASTSPKTSA